MSGATPFYGIRYPDGTTKVLNLGAELKQFALDFEAALRRETVFGNDVLADLYAVAQAVNGAVTPTENAMAASAASPSSPLRQTLDALYGRTPKVLAQGADLNAVLEPGIYAVSTPKQYPGVFSAETWFLECLALNGFVHHRMTHLANPSLIFTRARNGSTGAWGGFARFTMST